MSQTPENEYHIVDMLIDDWECSYSFYVQDREYNHIDSEYDGFNEMLHISFVGYAPEENKHLKIDKHTKISLLVNFSNHLGDKK